MQGYSTTPFTFRCEVWQRNLTAARLTVAFRFIFHGHDSGSCKQIYSRLSFRKGVHLKGETAQNCLAKFMAQKIQNQNCSFCGKGFTFQELTMGVYYLRLSWGLAVLQFTSTTISSVTVRMSKSSILIRGAFWNKEQESSESLVKFIPSFCGARKRALPLKSLQHIGPTDHQIPKGA